MFAAGSGTDEPTGQLKATAREADVFASLNLDTPGGAGIGSGTLPGQRGDLAAAVTLKLDLRFDGSRDRRAGPCEEPAAIYRVQSSNVSGFIERDELILAVAEFAPELEIEEGVLLPLVTPAYSRSSFSSMERTAGACGADTATMPPRRTAATDGATFFRLVMATSADNLYAAKRSSVRIAFANLRDVTPSSFQVC